MSFTKTISSPSIYALASSSELNPLYSQPENPSTASLHSSQDVKIPVFLPFRTLQSKYIKECNEL